MWQNQDKRFSISFACSQNIRLLILWYNNHWQPAINTSVMEAQNILTHYKIPHVKCRQWPYTSTSRVIHKVLIYCHISVTRNGVWIGNYIYWTPIPLNCKHITLSVIYTFYKSLQHALSQSVIVFASHCSVMVPKNGNSFALMLTALPASSHLTSNS